MEINPNRSFSSLNKSTAKKGVSRSKSSASTSGDATDISQGIGLSGLESALEAMPEERPERLEEGKQLVKDPTYPNEEQKKEIGELVLKDRASVSD